MVSQDVGRREKLRRDKLKETVIIAPGQKATCSLYACVLIAVASSFQWGYHTAVMSPAEDTTLPGHSVAIWSIVVTAMVGGGIAGAILGKPLLQRIGSKNSIILTGLTNLMGSLCVLFTGDSVGIAMAGRIMVGIAAGLCMCAVPVYIGEVAPLQIRGTLNGLPQLFNCVGILAAQVLGFFEVEAPGLLGFGVFVATAQLLAAMCVPLVATPEDTIVREVRRSGSEMKISSGSCCAAEDASMRLYGFSEEDAVNYTILLERACVGGGSDQAEGGGLFSDAAYTRMTISVIALNMIQQLSGFNAILQYSATFFRPLFSNPALPTVMVGIANLIGSTGTTAVMESTPRKRLLAISLGGMLLSTVVVATASGVVVVAGVVGFALCFQVGLGPLPGCFASEMYDPTRKSSAQGLAVMMNWFANFAVTLAFPTVYDALQVFTFVIFGAVLIVGLVFAFLILPETLHKTPAQVHASLSGAEAREASHYKALPKA